MALGVVVVLFAGCGVSVAAKQVAPTPSATPASQAHLNWQPLTMPPHAEVTPYTLAFAPSDGDVIYACNIDAQANSQQLQLWVTRDRSAHWTHLADFTVHGGTNQCSITVDDWQPMTAVVAVDTAPMGASPGISSFVSYATIAGVTYADLSILPASGEVDEIASSADGLRAWQPLQQTQSFGLGEGNSGFWLDPKNGALLVEGTLPTGTSLWRSDDRGTHWTALSTPVSPGDLSLAQIVVQTHAGVWQICIASSPGNGSTPSSGLTCSLDGGQTWSTRPGLNVAFTNPSKGTVYAPADVFALDEHGALLAATTVPDFANGTHETSVTTFYRLSPRAQQWQPIGGFDGQAYPIGLYPTPSGDVLWADGQPVLGQNGVAQGWQLAPYP